jgi:hypothetical protein
MIENDEQRVTTGLNDFPAVLDYRWVDQSISEGAKPFECSQVIQLNKSAIADHIGVNDGDQPSAAWGPADQVQ